MQPWQSRVIDEKSELDGRISRLRDYLEGEMFRSLDPLDQDLMRRQLGYMEAYSLTLRQRIKNFERPHGTV